MKTRKSVKVQVCSAFVVLAAAAFSRPARADLPRDPDGIDAHCSLAEQCPDGAECPSGVRLDAGAVQACRETQKAAGRTYRCQRDGNYSGTALYCREGTTGSWKGKTAPKGKGACSKSSLTNGDASPAYALGFFAAISLLIARRRRSSR